MLSAHHTTFPEYDQIGDDVTDSRRSEFLIWTLLSITTLS